MTNEFIDELDLVLESIQRAESNEIIEINDLDAWGFIIEEFSRILNKMEDEIN